MKAPGAYSLQPSPDGRWLLGVTNSPQPSLDIFDLAARTLARRIPVPAGPVTGAWAGDRFYLFSYGPDRGTGRLWSVKPEDTRAFRRSDGSSCRICMAGATSPLLLMLAGARTSSFWRKHSDSSWIAGAPVPDAAQRAASYVIQPSRAT